MNFYSKISGSELSETATGIEVCQNSDGTYYYNVLTLRKKNNDTDIIQQHSQLNEEELKKVVDKKFPICLVLNIKGIIHRKFPAGTENVNLLNKILPNANPDDFSLQFFSNSFLSVGSVIRNDLCKEWIEKFKSFGFTVISITSGPFLLNNLLAFFHSKEDNREQAISTYVVKIQDNNINDFESIAQANHQHNITSTEIENLSSEMMSAFAAAFNYLLYEIPLSFDNALAKENQKTFLAKSSFFKKGRLLLFGLFILLLINFLTFNHYFNLSKELQRSVNGYGIVLKTMDSLKNEFQQRQMLIDSLGLSLGSKTAYYCDQLAYDIPHEITLNQLNLNPSSANETNWQIEKNKVILEGASPNAAILNQWMKILKQKDFVEKVDLVKYHQESSNDVGSFAINLQLK